MSLLLEDKPPVELKSADTTKIYSLHQGRSKSPVVRLVPNHSTGLYRIEWQDIALSDRTNLTRAKAAARESQRRCQRIAADCRCASATSPLPR